MLEECAAGFKAEAAGAAGYWWAGGGSVIMIGFVDIGKVTEWVGGGRRSDIGYVHTNSHLSLKRETC